MHDSPQGRQIWAPGTVYLPFTVGEAHLGEVRLPAWICNLHFSRCPEATQIGALLPGDDAPPGVAAVRSCPTLRPLPRVAMVDGKLRYAERHYRRYTIDLSGTYEQYLDHFSRKTRGTLTRKLRRFSEASGGDIDWRQYQTVAEVDDFFAAALSVAERTYQFRLFEDRFTGDDAARQEARRLAEQGRFLGSILRFSGRPIAFLYSPIMDAHLLYRHLGYDPEFEQWSPGTVLLMLVLQSAFREKPASNFDFFEGGSGYKALFATSSTLCADLYFFPVTVRNRLLVYSHTAVHALSRILAGIAARLGLKSWLKARIRRWWPARKDASSRAGSAIVLRRYFSYFADSLRTRGIVKTLAVLGHGAWMFLPRPRSEFDRSRGIETDGLRSLHGLTIESRNRFDGVHYEPFPAGPIRSAIASLRLELSDYVFIDLGCGKGRALAVASEFPFAELVGVEFARELHATALRNMQRLALGNRCDLRLMDAADFPFADRPTVLFLFNPFGPAVMSQVVEKLRRVQAPVVVLYAAPRHGTLFSDFSLISRDARDVDVYANQAAARRLLEGG